jgi:hypothetical protein
MTDKIGFFINCAVLEPDQAEVGGFSESWNPAYSSEIPHVFI